MKITITKVADIQKLMNFGHEKKSGKKVSRQEAIDERVKRREM